jgi:ankyrin repeat protein
MLDVTRYLLRKRVDFKMPNIKGNTPLIMSLMCDSSVEVIEELIDAYGPFNPDINHRNNKGSCAIHYALPKAKVGTESYTSSFKIMKILINAGTNINIQNSIGDSPLALACANRLYNHAEFLINKGADVNQTDNEGRTPLVHAVLTEPASNRCNTRTIQNLINAGANINVVDAEGNTLLAEAVSSGNTKIVRLLVNSGIEDVENNNGETAHRIALLNGDAEMLKLLRPDIYHNVTIVSY